jgi:L-lysine 2,3-aminomutase
LADAVRSADELCRLLHLPADMADAIRVAAQGFPLLVPHPYLARIRPGDPHDPLLRQVLPTAAERQSATGFTADPLGEAHLIAGQSLLNKYAGRVLLLTTASCPVHCRFCFRRHFPFDGPASHGDRFQASLDQIAADPSIHEVVLSGGDPLSLDDDELADLVERLSSIPHVRRVRIHTRWPVMIPQRVTAGLLAAIRSTRLTPLVVVHVNHPAEIDDVVGRALGDFIDAGVPVLSQSVLLRGVNDSVATLAELFGRLVDLRVVPYYLHQLDRVAGAAHFEVGESAGRDLVEQLRARLPGYAIPRYVRETPGDRSKRVLA